MKRPVAWLTAGALAAALTGVVSGTASSAGTNACDSHGHHARYLCAKPGDLVEFSIGDLRPTQPALGYDEVYYKLGRYTSTKDEDAGEVNKRFDDWCETNGQDEAKSVEPGARLDDPSSFTCTVPVGEETGDTLAQMKTAVIGPNGTPYLTDGHHSLTAFLEAPDGGPDTRIRLKIAANFSDLSTRAFWRAMRANEYVWLRDENDRPITVHQLPKHLGLKYFGNDAYRGLVYFTRDIGYSVPDDAREFLEFSWGSWLRRSYDLNDYDLTDFDTYLALVKQVSQDMTALSDDDVVDGTNTAGDLGKLAEWNDGDPPDKGEFAKLSKPLSDDKPGKLAFALDYERSH